MAEHTAENRVASQSCESCRFHSSHRDGFNLCQRRSPVISPEIMGDSAHMGVWPETDPSDRCGEWEYQEGGK